MNNNYRTVDVALYGHDKRELLTLSMPSKYLTSDVLDFLDSLIERESGSVQIVQGEGMAVGTYTKPLQAGEDDDDNSLSSDNVAIDGLRVSGRAARDSGWVWACKDIAGFTYDYVE